jgi:hypothetical protein
VFSRSSRDGEKNERDGREAHQFVGPTHPPFSNALIFASRLCFVSHRGSPVVRPMLIHSFALPRGQSSVFWMSVSSG